MASHEPFLVLYLIGLTGSIDMMPEVLGLAALKQVVSAQGRYIRWAGTSASGVFYVIV